VAVTGVASAQVTMYGVMDQGYGSVTTESDAGVQASKTTGMVSGVQSGSRWGIKGAEDLGGGLTASFQLESAVSVGDGASTGFTRTSKFALDGSFGTVSMGAQYTPSFSVLGASDVTGVDGSTTASIMDVRADNMFMYTSPRINGIQVVAGMSGNKTDSTSGTTTTESDIKDITVSYAAGPVYVAAGSYAINSTAASVVTAEITIKTIAATYDLGVAKLYFNKLTNSQSSVDNAETNYGVKMPMGAVTLLAGYGKNTADSSTSSTDYTIGADYAFSKRTNAYARIAKGQAVNAGTITKEMYVGVRHSF
jgi:predicted porin